MLGQEWAWSGRDRDIPSVGSGRVGRNLGYDKAGLWNGRVGEGTG